jgi:(p)ppGpp synthase/HD superfamily hydrolase
MSNRLQFAISLAEFVHEDQFYGDKKYIAHLRDVASIMEDWIDNPGLSNISMFDLYDDLVDVFIIAYLHDSIEDTNLNLKTIENLFGQFVAECISLLTDPKLKNRKERKKASHEKLSKVKDKYQLALVVKAADRLANVRACINSKDDRIDMYREEYLEFKTAVFREGLNGSLFDELDRLLLKE